MIESRHLKILLVGTILSGPVAGVVAGGARAGFADKTTLPAPLRGQVDKAIARGLKYLEASQEPDGAWVKQPGPAITAMAAQCFVQNPRYGPNHPIVRRALDFVLKHRQSDGGIYDSASGLRNYNTSICLMFLASLPEADPRVRQARDGAVAFLKGLQWAEHRKDSEGETITPKHVWYGGSGYGRHKRPDLSNTQMMLEALKQSGLPPTDPVFKKAMRFIDRCQMSSETNDQLFARAAADGGFIYSPHGGGESKAGTVVVDGTPMLRSYGSMTYAGFKSMLYADVSRDDVRVRRALEWIGKHYSLDTHPNMPGQQFKQGLYYYYNVFSRALLAWGEPTIKDAEGKHHNWRRDVCGKLVDLQHADGYWVNLADRWMEGSPQLVTAYSILALQTAIESKSSRSSRGIHPAR